MADVSVEEFSAEVSAFLDANAKRKAEEHKPFVWGEGEDDSMSLFEETDEEAEQRALVEAKAWRAERYDAGPRGGTGPQGVGGGGLSPTPERGGAARPARNDNPP